MISDMLEEVVVSPLTLPTLLQNDNSLFQSYNYGDQAVQNLDNHWDFYV